MDNPTKNKPMTEEELLKLQADLDLREKAVAEKEEALKEKPEDSIEQKAPENITTVAMALRHKREKDEAAAKEKEEADKKKKKAAKK